MYTEYTLSTLYPEKLNEYRCTQNTHWVYCTQITHWVPLYPQYSLSTTLSTVLIEYHSFHSTHWVHCTQSTHWVHCSQSTHWVLLSPKSIIKPRDTVPDMPTRRLVNIDQKSGIDLEISMRFSIHEFFNVSSVGLRSFSVLFSTSFFFRSFLPGKSTVLVFIGEATFSYEVEEFQDGENGGSQQ